MHELGNKYAAVLKNVPQLFSLALWKIYDILFLGLYLLSMILVQPSSSKEKKLLTY